MEFRDSSFFPNEAWGGSVGHFARFGRGLTCFHAQLRPNSGEPSRLRKVTGLLLARCAQRIDSRVRSLAFFQFPNPGHG
jgi:hypothetical protein